jgi:NAD(P)-dependent dehydrogenase (short-subunit alcohol dehydrogenase family)
MTLRTVNEAALDEIWAVNCKAPVNMIHCALPHLEASGSGRIVNVASLSGKRVANDNFAYSMSKFAVMSLTHAARRIAWDKGVRATAVCPGFVRTDMTVEAQVPARGNDRPGGPCRAGVDGDRAAEHRGGGGIAGQLPARADALINGVDDQRGQTPLIVAAKVDSTGPASINGV